jgi:hypothetical protein
MVEGEREPYVRVWLIDDSGYDAILDGLGEGSPSRLKHTLPRMGRHGGVPVRRWLHPRDAPVDEIAEYPADDPRLPARMREFGTMSWRTIVVTPPARRTEPDG